MRHALVIAHPRRKSFTQAMAKAYAGELHAQGHEVLIRDLYGMDFDPRLTAREDPWMGSPAPRADASAERKLLRDVKAFAFFYPVWFNAPPAILKGYVDRIFGMGFGYGMGEEGGNAPLLVGRSLVSFSSSGAPKSWMVETGAWDAVCKLFDEHVGSVTGLAVLDHVHFGGIVPGVTAETVRSCAVEVRQTAAQHFALAKVGD